MRPPRYLRRLQEAAAAAAAAHQENQNGSEIPRSPASTSQSAASPTQTALTASAHVPFLDTSLGSVQGLSALPPSRYPIAADGFHSQFPPLTMSVPSSFGNSRLPEHMGMSMSSRSSPRQDEPPQCGSPSDQFSTYPLHNWSYKQYQALSVLPPSVIPPLSYHYRPHRLEDVAPRDTILLIIALFFDFVYPLTPCVHKPSFMADIHARREERDPLFFALVMATVASTLVQVPRSYLPMERHAVRKLAQTCHEASRHISVASYDPPTSMHVVIRYLYVIFRELLVLVCVLSCLRACLSTQRQLLSLLRGPRRNAACSVWRSSAYCRDSSHARGVVVRRTGLHRVRSPSKDVLVAIWG